MSNPYKIPGFSTPRSPKQDERRSLSPGGRLELEVYSAKQRPLSISSNIVREFGDRQLIVLLDPQRLLMEESRGEMLHFIFRLDPDRVQLDPGNYLIETVVDGAVVSRIPVCQPAYPVLTRHTATLRVTPEPAEYQDTPIVDGTPT